MSSSSSAANQQPTATQVLFARAVIYTMELWPVMRLAVAEQWGGPESKDKRDFLVSHLCDEYSNEPSPLVQQQASQGASAGAATAPIRCIPPKTPDVDDLAETFGMYFDDEFESRIEDGSADWVARRIVHLHKCIYAKFPATQESLSKAQEQVGKLGEAVQRLRGTNVEAQQNEGRDILVGDDEEISSDDDSDSHTHGSAATDAMDIDGATGSSARQARQARPEPTVDDEGFTTVVKGRRR